MIKFQVVGGMTWCIDSSDIDLDVDLLFEEGLTTGQKMWASDFSLGILLKFTLIVSQLISKIIKSFLSSTYITEFGLLSPQACRM